MHAREHVFQRIGAVSAYPRAEVSYKLCHGIYLVERGLTDSFKRKISLGPVVYILFKW